MTAFRLGVLGGSFNPIHLGHLHIAETTGRIFGLSRILFVVATIPPHKPPEGLIPFEHRYAMVSLATSGSSCFVPSLVERESPASPYSIDTLSKLSREYDVSGEQIYFVAGADSLLEVSGWHDGAALLASYNFVFVSRPGVPVADAHACLPPEVSGRLVDLRKRTWGELADQGPDGPVGAGCRIFLIDVDAPDVAASQIRSMAALGKPIQRLVPPGVQEYIAKLHLYGER